MKNRSGFVSNSSSSSFIVNLNELTAREALRLMEYPSAVVESAEQRGWKDSWTIEVNLDQNRISGWTAMDNGDLGEYLEKWGIDDKKFSWESD